MIDWDSIVIGPTVGVFGQPVLYQPMVAAGAAGLTDNRVPAGPAFQITGVFDEEYLELAPIALGQMSFGATDMLGIPSHISSARPVLGIQLSQFTQRPAQGDVLTVMETARSFVVQEVRPDGHGGAKLLLNDAP